MKTRRLPHRFASPASFASILMVLLLPGFGVVLPCPGAESSDVSGWVMTEQGEPVPGAAVYVFTAAPKDGRALICPSCCPDCSKSTRTDDAGKFILKALSNDLEFRLLAVASGFLPRYMRDVDPEAGEANATLKPISFPKAAMPQRIRGKVLDGEGRPVAGAIIEVEGAKYGAYTLAGAQGRCDTVAATDPEGVFELTCSEELLAALITLKPRGLARAKRWLEPGKAYLIRAHKGVTVKGRLLFRDKPVAEVAVSMATQVRNSEEHLAGMEVATDEEGRFTLTQIPPNNRFYLHPLMKDMASIGGNIPPRPIVTGEDGATIDVGDVVLAPALSIRGRLVLADGKSVPDRTRIDVSPGTGFESAQVLADDEGDFEILGLPPGPLTLRVRMDGYRVSPKNPSKDWYNEGSIIGTLRGSLEGFLIHLEPGGPQRGGGAVRQGGQPRDEPLRSAPSP